MKLKPRGRNDSHKFEYSKISKHLFVGSDFCTGRNCKEHEEEFKKLNIDSEINLSIEKKEVPPENIESYTWIPVVDGHAPTMWQMEAGASIIDKAVASGKNIYVHCRNGHGRSPTLVAAYLIRYGGISVDEAIEEIEKKRPEAHIEKTQKDALRKFSEK
jgi:protein-tyrosine phosphatase